MARSIIFIFPSFSYKSLHHWYVNPEVYTRYDMFILISSKKLHIQIINIHRHFSCMIHLKCQEDSTELKTFAHFERLNTQVRKKVLSFWLRIMQKSLIIVSFKGRVFVKWPVTQFCQYFFEHMFLTVSHPLTSQSTTSQPSQLTF